MLNKNLSIQKLAFKNVIHWNRRDFCTRATWKISRARYFDFDCVKFAVFASRAEVFHRARMTEVLFRAMACIFAKTAFSPWQNQRGAASVSAVAPARVKIKRKIAIWLNKLDRIFNSLRGNVCFTWKGNLGGKYSNENFHCLGKSCPILFAVLVISSLRNN